MKSLRRTKCHETCALLDFYKEANQGYKEQIDSFECKSKIFDNIEELVSRDNIILAVRHNRNDVVYVTMINCGTTDYGSHTNTSINFYVHTYTVSGMYVQQELQTKIVSQNDCCYVSIYDFKGYENQGHGSILMEEFLKYIRGFPISKVIGFLSSVDLNRPDGHKDLLYHFYKKFGFTITEDDQIYLEL